MRLVAIGVAAGFFSALFGIGGGILIVPLLILFVGYRERHAMATSLAAIGITALAGVITYAFHGEVEPAAAALVGLPAALGAMTGASLQQRLQGRFLSVAFAAFLVAVAVLLVVE